MTRIAIIGGGISGLTAAYELELARRAGAPIDWHLYEASSRLGGIIETTRHTTPAGDFILEGGPDGWVSEKPWARELAIELGLEADLIYSNDATRKTYIFQPDPDEAGKANHPGRLLAIPDRMRLMVPEDLATLENSPLFTAAARAAYANELANAAQLKSNSSFADPTHDESVAAFVLRHFGDEVLTKLVAPLLSGVFGGDPAKLSARAVMPQFVAMERDHGSLIAALQVKSHDRTTPPPQPIFTSLRNGMASLVEALAVKLPTDRVHIGHAAFDLDQDVFEWYIDFMPPKDRTFWRRLKTVIPYWDHVFLATPLDTSRRLLHWLDPYGSALIRSKSSFLGLVPTDVSSAILVTFCWPADLARAFTVSTGFGFLVPQKAYHPDPELIEGEGPASRSQQHEPQLLACTFVDQKFPHRAPPGARILRAFFGGPAAETLSAQPDETIAAAALAQLRQILGPLPVPDASITTIRRWPRSLPQYEVGHLNRMAQLDALISQTPGLHLLGNSYRGVGLPDLIRDARAAARRIAQRTTAAPSH